MPMSKTRSADKSSDRVKKRTSRACDRCRLKKSKCDGGIRCRTCEESDSPCTYNARRGREARSFYWQMLEVTEEALQRLYWACRRRDDFPGTLPVEAGGNVSTSDILVGLGLIGPGINDLGFPKDLKFSNQGQTASRAAVAGPSQHGPGQFQSRKSTIAPTEAKVGLELSLSLSSPIHMPSLAPDQSQTSITATPPEPSTPPQADARVKTQFVPVAAVAGSLMQASPKGSSPYPGGIRAQKQGNAPGLTQTPDQAAADSFLNPDVFSGINSWAVRAMNIQVPSLPDPPRLLCDSFLSPWPGSLQAAYQGALSMERHDRAVSTLKQQEN